MTAFMLIAKELLDGIVLAASVYSSIVAAKTHR